MIPLQTRRVLPVLLPAVVDGVTIWALITWMPTFTQKLENPSGWNAFRLVSFYICFSIGVYLIRKLEPLQKPGGWQPPALFMNQKSRVVLAFLFGLLMMTTAAFQIGYFESILSIGSATLDEGDSSALLVYMPGALLGFSMLYILVLAFPVQSNVLLRSRWYWFVLVVGLFFTNGMLFFTVSQAAAVVSALHRMGGIGLIVVLFIALFLSFAPPRLLYQNKQPYSYSIVSFLILLMFAVFLIAY